MIGLRPNMPLRDIPEAKYLTEAGAPTYRIIVAYVYDRRELGIGWVTRSELLEVVRARLNDRDPDAAQSYDERQCEADLTQLATWGTLVRHYNLSAPRSVEEFTLKQLKYALAPITVALEEGIRLFRAREGSRGALDPSLLQNLWNDLRDLDDLLTTPVSADPSPERSNLRTGWVAAYERFVLLRKAGIEFQGALTAQADTPSVQLEALIAYKQILQQNLTAFGTRLRDYADSMRMRVQSWDATAVPQWLVPALAADDLETVVRHDVPPSRYELEAVYLEQFRALAAWLAPRTRAGSGAGAGGAAYLAEAMGTAVQRAIEDTRRLTEQLIAGDSRRRDLATLARSFAACHAAADAHRLAGITCGVAEPRHLVADVERPLAAGKSVWAQGPLTVPLRPMVRGGGARGQSAPLFDNDEEEAKMQDEAAAERARERADWARLFAAGTLVLDDVWLDSHALRSQMLSVISQCLTRVDRTGIAPDGSRIRLEPPDPAAPVGRIRTRNGGAIWLPRYRLTRTVAAEEAA
jgi:uncharacterized protein (TIGR02677 family)